MHVIGETLGTGNRGHGVGQVRSQQRNRLLAGAFAVAVHLLVFIAFLWMHTWPTTSVADTPSSSIEISFVDLPKPPGPPAEKVTAGGSQIAQKLAPPQPVILPPVPTATGIPTPDTSDLLNESDLIGAASVGEGGAGGGLCNMAQLVQQALQRDPSVHTAVRNANRLGKAILVWNGDWVQSGEQEGKGLAVVREAILWKVAFAPEDCRTQRVHGRMVLSLGDQGTRFVVGADDWRWSDLLGVVPLKR